MTHAVLSTTQDFTVPMAGHLENACALLIQQQEQHQKATQPSTHDNTTQRPILSSIITSSTEDLSSNVSKIIEETGTLLRDVIVDLKSRTPSPASDEESTSPRSPHPLIIDEEDVERIVAANLRLLQGLKRKMDDMVELERRLKEKERETENESAVEFEENDEIEIINPVSAPVSPQTQKPQLSAFPPQTKRTISIQTHTKHVVTDDEEEDPEKPVVEWTPEMEEELKQLEKSLRQANKKWSDEQEEVLEPLERLRDLKRQHNKRLRRQNSGVTKGGSNVKISMVNIKKTMSFSRSETNSLFNFKEEQNGVDGKKVGKLLKAIKKVF